MYEIVSKQVLNPTVVRMKIKAPLIAKKAEAGQFIILRTDKDGERIPLTIADFDREKGTVTINDKGALDCVIQARVETAVRRASEAGV